MKLSELDAKFWTIPGRTGMGLIFRVPGTPPERYYEPKVAIPFSNPLDGGPPDPTGM